MGMAMTTSIYLRTLPYSAGPFQKATVPAQLNDDDFAGVDGKAGQQQQRVGMGAGSNNLSASTETHMDPSRTSPTNH